MEDEDEMRQEATNTSLPKAKVRGPKFSNLNNKVLHS